MHPRGTDTPNFPQKLIKIIENFNQKLTPKRGGEEGCSVRMQIMVVSERHQRTSEPCFPSFTAASIDIL